MYESEVEKVLTSIEMEARPDPCRVQAVHERMMDIARREAAHPHRGRNRVSALLVVIGVSGLALAGTKTGRSFVQWVFTPIGEVQSTQWVAPSGELWSRTQTGRSEPFTPEEEEDAAKQFAENYASKQAGEGRLVGLIENPGFMGTSLTIYQIEYTQSNGAKTVVGSGRPVGLQAENLRVDEITQLRDAGEGRVIEHYPFLIGMGKYTIRLTLSDDTTVDLQTFFPPGTLDERERIFEEMRELKASLRFTVLNAFVDSANPMMGVWGNLRYELADGRIVGASEQLPMEVISEDGTQVVMPDQETTIPIAGTKRE